MKNFPKIILIVLCCYFSITVATSPPTPPYHQYYVMGKIERVSNGNKANFVVSLVGKFNIINIDSVVDIKGRYISRNNENGRYLTDSSGYFSILVSSSEKADSLALKVSAPDKQDVIGLFFDIGEPSFISKYESTEDRTGCNCEYSTDAKKNIVTDYYRYDFHNIVVTIP